jgi:hypothetical protein
MRSTHSQPRPTRRLRGSLDGPSRTITVEPVEMPTPAPAPEIRPERAPVPPSEPSRPPAPGR